MNKKNVNLCNTCYLPRPDFCKFCYANPNRTVPVDIAITEIKKENNDTEVIPVVSFCCPCCKNILNKGQNYCQQCGVKFTWVDYV